MADVVSAIGASDIDTSDGSVVEKLFGSSVESSVDNPMSSKNQEVLEEAGSDYEPAHEELVEYARWLGKVRRHPRQY